MEYQSTHWLARPQLTAEQKLARYFYLVACCCGLVIKVLAASAAEGVTMRKFLQSYTKSRTQSAGLTNKEVGAVVILSGRGYAKMAQEKVQELALRWRRLKHSSPCVMEPPAVLHTPTSLVVPLSLPGSASRYNSQTSQQIRLPVCNSKLHDIV